MKKPNKKLKELISKYAKEHVWNLGYTHYKMDLTFAEKDKETDKGIVAAEMAVQRRYLKCELIIFPYLETIWKERGDKVLSEIIAHEVSHLATQHLFELTLQPYKTENESSDAWETLTETIGRLSAKIYELESKKK